MEVRKGSVPGGNKGHQADGTDHDGRSHRSRASEPDIPRVSGVLQGGGRVLHLRNVQHAPVRGGVSGIIILFMIQDITMSACHLHFPVRGHSLQ